MMGFASLNPSYRLPRGCVGWVERSETHHPSLPKLPNHFNIPTPIRRIDPLPNIPAKGGKRPIRHPVNITMLEGIDMNVIHVASKILFIPDPMLPETPLPQTPLAFPGATGRDRLAAGQSPAEMGLDQSPTGREIVVAFGQCPQRMHVIGQHHPGVDMKWPVRSDATHRRAQTVDLPNQQIRSPIGNGHRKKPRCPPSTIPPVVRHANISTPFRYGFDGFRCAQPILRR